MAPHPALRDLSVDGYAALLRERLAALSQRADPWQQMQALHLFDEEPAGWQAPVEAWRQFHGGLAPPARHRLQQALAQVLAQSRPGYLADESVAVLVLLVGAIQAHVALPALVGLVADGATWGRHRPLLWVDVLAVLKGLPLAEADAATVARLADAGLPPVLLPDLLDALVRSQPTQWAEYWRAWLPRLQQLQQQGPAQLPPGTTAPQWFARRVGSLVQQRMARWSPQVLADGLGTLVTALDADRLLSPDSPTWVLLHALLVAPDRPFHLLAEDGADWLARQNQRQVRARLPQGCTALVYEVWQHLEAERWAHELQGLKQCMQQAPQPLQEAVRKGAQGLSAVGGGALAQGLADWSDSQQQAA